ncbi:hypothetical protein ACOKM3_07570 [Streptomyces sp. BH106]|uniref:hypothetical protein n=1 Tax=Streptomyces sp. BH106 TaxID=3410409 RepID=UPI003CE9ADA1
MTRTQLGMILGGISLALVGSALSVVMAPEVSAWTLTVLIVGGTCGVGACGIALREYRRGWPK